MGAIQQTGGASIVNFASNNTTHLTANRRAITDNESNMLRNTGLEKNVIDNVKETGVASSYEEAMSQFGNYVEKTIPQDRKPIVVGHLKTAQQNAKEKDIDTVSAIGLELATADDTTPEEKVMGVDLYTAQMLKMEEKANAQK